MYVTKKILEIKDVLVRKIIDYTTQNNQPDF